jgi:hypothetical protein
MPKRFPMSAVDTAALRMDRRTNHMLIVGVLVLERKISIERCR